jgi:hypothetical protein
MKGHEWAGKFAASLEHVLTGWLPRYRKRNLTRDEFGQALFAAMLRMPAECGNSLMHAEDEECPDCSDITATRNAAWLALADALDTFAGHGLEAFREHAPVPDTAAPADGLMLRCIVCAAPMTAIRKTKVTCSDRCRQRLCDMRRKQAEAEQDAKGQHGRSLTQASRVA